MTEWSVKRSHRRRAKSLARLGHTLISVGTLVVLFGIYQLVVTDTLPADWTFVSATGTGYTCGNAGQVVTCTRTSALSSGTQETLSVVAQAPTAVAATGTAFTNSFTVASSTPDPTTGNNTASVVVNVIVAFLVASVASVASSPFVCPAMRKPPNAMQ